MEKAGQDLLVLHFLKFHDRPVISAMNPNSCHYETTQCCVLMQLNFCAINSHHTDFQFVKFVFMIFIYITGCLGHKLSTFFSFLYAL
jgi:hypothetical protein